MKFIDKNYSIGEIIYESLELTVYRGERVRDAQKIIVKLIRSSHTSFQDIFRLQNQYDVVKGLNLTGVVEVISFQSYKQDFILVLEDFDSISLAEYFSSLNPVESADISINDLLNVFFPIAIQMTEILEELCLHDIVHKDIKPANIRIDPQTQLVKLTNFNYAIRSGGLERQIPIDRTFEGTLAYASPEQTGRTSRQVDYRSDFYSLGVTFYELLTGKLPFETANLIELIHAHLSKRPIPVHEIQPLIPKMLSAIVSKLMAKDAEDRYQSVLPLQRDLEYCWSQWQTEGEIKTFELGERAADDRFHIPAKIYGRTLEIEQILTAVDRLRQGRGELVLLSGFFGVGKTAIINEVYQNLRRQPGYFIKGEFLDSSSQDLPFNAFIQALRSLMGQLLSEDDDRLAKYQADICAKLGDDAQIIIDVIPELSQIIGTQPPVIFLSVEEHQRRFKLLFHDFIRIFTKLVEPLVIFLDNLQWIDESSLELLEMLMQGEDPVLIICAYRDNELSVMHPLMLTINQLRRVGVTVNKIVLSALSAKHIAQLVADAFNCQIATIQPLANLVYQKTNGNVFFAIKFIKSLAQNKLIIFNPQTESWQCDLSQVKTHQLTNDEIDLMAMQLQQLPLFTQQLLKLAACLGIQFDLEILAIIAQQPESEVSKILWPALEQGSIFPAQETYNFFPSAQDLPQLNSLAITSYKFPHSLIQQAAYSLLNPSEQAIMHTRIGKLLLSTISGSVSIDAITPGQIDPAIDHRFLMAVNQLNYAVDRVHEASHRYLLIQVNLIASHHAKNTNSYQLALNYAQIALNLLSDRGWQEVFDLTFSAYELAIELAALCGKFELMNQWIDVTITHVDRPLALVSVYIVQIQALVSQNLAVSAVELGKFVLAQLGVELLASPTQADVDRAIAEVNDLIRARLEIAQPQALETLADLPPMTDPHQLGVMRVAASIMRACAVTDPRLYALVVTVQMKLSIRFGNSYISAHTYAAYGTLINNYLLDLGFANRLGGVGYALASNPTAKSARSATLATIGWFLHHRNSHLRKTIPIFQAGYQVGRETGKFEDVGHHIEGLFTVAYWCGDKLSELEYQLLEYRQQLLDLHQLATTNYCDIYCETVLCLLGNPASINLGFDRVANEQLVLASQDLKRIFLFYFHRAMVAFFTGDSIKANADALRARGYLSGVMGLIDEVGFYFYDSQIAIASSGENPSGLATTIERVRANQQQLRHWAESAPMNHLHKWQLVEAETYRICGDKSAAIEFYDLAIAGAQAHDYPQETALANELAAKFYLDWGKVKIAADYLQSAYHYYRDWGAIAKIQDLTHQYPQLLAPIIPAYQLTEPTGGSTPKTVITGDPTGELSGGLAPAERIDVDLLSFSRLDFAAYNQAIQALYQENDLHRLLRTLLDTIVENAGADKAVLLLNQDGKLTVAIEYDYRTMELLEADLHTFDREDRVPLYLVRHVQRTLTTKIYDGINHTDLVNDPYFDAHRPPSILCLPILHQGKSIGVLYLENTLTSGVFTQDRVQLLTTICTQAAISLENVRLHQSTQAYAHKLEQSLRDLELSETRLHKIADHLPGVIAQFCIYPDRDTDILRYISSGCVELYELTAAEMMSGGYSLRCFEHPEDRPQIDQAIAQSVAELTPIQLEYRIVTASGQVKWIHLAASSLEPQPDGSLLAECTILDISERKQAEIQLQITNAELIHSNRLKDEFMANMSHELRTPLNAILGMAEGLKEQVFGAILSTQLTAINTIESSGQQLLELIDNILELAKFEARQVKLDCTPTEIVGVCRSCWQSIEPQALKKQLQFEIKIQPNLPDLWIDERLIRKAVIELLTNAIKFTPSGGQIGLEVAYLDISDSTSQTIDRHSVTGRIEPVSIGKIRITVNDTGIGIASDYLQQLFQPFVQIDGSFTRQFAGTGLGLALVKRIVELHGGQVEVSSQLNIGSKFIVDLPCDNPPPLVILEQGTARDRGSTNELPSQLSPISNRLPLILLVEDNEANISTMSSYLKAKGYQIVIAQNVQEAIDLTIASSPDIMIMDMQMSGIDGLVATIQCSDVPIIALTDALNSDESTAQQRERYLAAGAHEHLSKPVKLKQLTATIKQLLEVNT